MLQTSAKFYKQLGKKIYFAALYVTMHIIGKKSPV